MDLNIFLVFLLTLESVFKLGVWFRKFAIKACAARKNVSLHFVNDHFESKRNADSGLYGQILFSSNNLYVDL